MFKKAIIISLLVLGATVPFAASVLAANQDVLPFRPFYWIASKVADVAGAGDAGKAAGKQVVFYKDDATYDQGYVTATIDENGMFILNAFDIYPIDLVVNKVYFIAIVNKDGFGADAVPVIISENGFVILPDGYLKLKAGAGPGAAPSGGVVEPAKALEKAPAAKLWFGNRLYQPAIYKGDKKFVVPQTPDMKIEFSIEPPFTLAQNIDAYSVVVDDGLPTAKNLSLTAQNVSNKSFAAGSEPKDNKIVGSELKYSFIEPLISGSHTFTIRSKSSGALGAQATASYVATVEVLGGPLRLIGTPITYPSPFSITKQGTVTIQYELSANANIDIYLTGVSGERIKRYAIASGQEGGSAGLNKVTWNGRTDQNYLAGNAIYVGTIIGKDDNKLLGKFKLTIVD